MPLNDIPFSFHPGIPPDPALAPPPPALEGRAPDPPPPDDPQPQVIHLGCRKFLIVFGIVVLILIRVLGILCALLLLSVGITYYPSVVQNYLPILGSLCILELITCTYSFFVIYLVGFGFMVLFDTGDNIPPAERERIGDRNARRRGINLIRVPVVQSIEVNGRELIGLPRFMQHLFN